MQTKVMVFGVFDGLHEGHHALFKEAREYGDFVIAVATPDHIVQQLKGLAPRRNLEVRIQDLRNEASIDDVVPGDDTLGGWHVITEHRPAIIALGYDQAALKTSLESNLGKFDWHPKIVMLQPHKPETHHSSLLEPRE
jgi:cytidyltransferase-like protein